MTFHTEAELGGVVLVAAQATTTRLASFLRLGVLACLISTVATGVAFAQTAAPSPPDKTKGVGGGKSSGPILTRDELRVCFSREASLKTRLDAVATERAVHGKEKDDIATLQQELKADRAKVDESKKQAEDFSVRVKAYSDRVASWNKRVSEHNEGKGSAAQSERMRIELSKEKDELTKDAAAFEAEKTRITTVSTEAVNSFNAKVAALDGRIKTWNERNVKLNDMAAALEQERSTWAAECADRRYREEDETAIRAGK